jgi:hypothetical protein
MGIVSIDQPHVNGNLGLDGRACATLTELSERSHWVAESRKPGRHVARGLTIGDVYRVASAAGGFRFFAGPPAALDDR